MNRISAYAAMILAYLLGSASLTLFGIFMLLGPIFSTDLGLSSAGALGLDAALSFAFFLQHSLMIRQSFRRRLRTLVPDHYQGALYTIASGMILLLLLCLWQPAAPTIYSADGPLRWFLRGLYFAAGLGGMWGVRALGSFDGFGIRPVKLKLRGKTLRPEPLVIRGPYRWIRHPMYTVVLVMLWSYPDLTADRLLLNLSWTIWIVIGALLEERDLVSTFGEPYREYQRRVPMLLPRKIPRLGQ